MHQFWRIPGVVSMLWPRKKLQALQKVKIIKFFFLSSFEVIQTLVQNFYGAVRPLVRSCMDGSTKGIEDRALDNTLPRNKKLIATCICLLNSRVKMALAVLVKLAES